MGSLPSLPSTMGNTNSRRRSINPSFIMLFTRLMLPMERIGSPGCVLRAKISSARSPLRIRVLFQASGSCKVFEKTSFGRLFILGANSGSEKPEDPAAGEGQYDDRIL